MYIVAHPHTFYGPYPLPLSERSTAVIALVNICQSYSASETGAVDLLRQRVYLRVYSYRRAKAA